MFSITLTAWIMSPWWQCDVGSGEGGGLKSKTLYALLEQEFPPIQSVPVPGGGRWCRTLQWLMAFSELHSLITAHESYLRGPPRSWRWESDPSSSEVMSKVDVYDHRYKQRKRHKRFFSFFLKYDSIFLFLFFSHSPIQNCLCELWSAAWPIHRGRLTHISAQHSNTTAFLPSVCSSVSMQFPLAVFFHVVHLYLLWPGSCTQVGI